MKICVPPYLLQYCFFSVLSLINCAWSFILRVKEGLPPHHDFKPWLLDIILGRRQTSTSDISKTQQLTLKYSSWMNRSELHHLLITFYILPQKTTKNNNNNKKKNSRWYQMSFMSNKGCFRGSDKIHNWMSFQHLNLNLAQISLIFQLAYFLYNILIS